MPSTASPPPPVSPPVIMPPPKELDEQYTRRTSFTISDAEVEARRYAAENRLLNADAKFRNHAGEAVMFAHLDFDLIVGLLNAYTYPVDGVESVPVEMRPKGVGGDAMEVDEPVPRVDGAASNGRPGEKVVAVRFSLHPTPTATTGPPGESQSVQPRPRRTPYEIVAYVDGPKPQVRRRQPGIERTWHPSKSRRALSLEMWDEFEEPFTMYSRYVPYATQVMLRDRFWRRERMYIRPGWTERELDVLERT